MRIPRIDRMGWLFGRKRDSDGRERGAAPVQRGRGGAPHGDDLRGRGEASVAARTSPPASAALSAHSSSTEFVVEDVFTITGRGHGRDGHGDMRECCGCGDDIVVLRDGASARADTAITGIEMFRKHANEATVGELAGLLLGTGSPIARGDVIRAAPSG